MGQLLTKKSPNGSQSPSQLHFQLYRQKYEISYVPLHTGQIVTPAVSLALPSAWHTYLLPPPECQLRYHLL